MFKARTMRAVGSVLQLSGSSRLEEIQVKGRKRRPNNDWQNIENDLRTAVERDKQQRSAESPR